LINSERRIGLVKKVKRAPGQALADFHIFQLVAHHWGCGEMFAQWTSPEAAFGLLKQASHGQPCDITGIRDYAHIDACGGIQWPWTGEEARAENGESPSMTACTSTAPKTAHPVPEQERRLFADGRFFTPDGRARFLFEMPRPVAEPTDADYPLVLLSGRGSSAQWHTGSRTNKSDVLRRLAPERCYVEVNPADAARQGIKQGAQIQVRSRRGSVEATAFVTPTVQPGQVFIPMHYPEVNRLTFPSFDPYSRQPSYKHCAVTLDLKKVKL
jgi:assimilatory nitrate reductase catalytic subunit